MKWVLCLVVLLCCVDLKTSSRPWEEREEEERVLCCFFCSKIISLCIFPFRLFHCKYIITDVKSAREPLWNDMIHAFLKFCPLMPRLHLLRNRTPDFNLSDPFCFNIESLFSLCCPFKLSAHQCQEKMQLIVSPGLSSKGLHHKMLDKMSFSCVPSQRPSPVKFIFPDRFFHHE